MTVAPATTTPAQASATMTKDDAKTAKTEAKSAPEMKASPEKGAMTTDQATGKLAEAGKTRHHHHHKAASNTVARNDVKAKTPDATGATTAK